MKTRQLIYGKFAADNPKTAERVLLQSLFWVYRSRTVIYKPARFLPCQYGFRHKLHCHLKHMEHALILMIPHFYPLFPGLFRYGFSIA